MVKQLLSRYCRKHEQGNSKAIHSQPIHRKGIVPIPPADESAGFLGTFFIEFPIERLRIGISMSKTKIWYRFICCNEVLLDMTDSDRIEIITDRHIQWCLKQSCHIPIGNMEMIRQRWYFFNFQIMIIHIIQYLYKSAPVFSVTPCTDSHETNVCLSSRYTSW